MQNSVFSCISRKQTMFISKIKLTSKCDYCRRKLLNQDSKFKYLENIITGGWCVTEIKSRLTKQKYYFRRCKVSNKSLSMNVRKRAHKYCIEHVLLYDSESWDMKGKIRKNLQAAEILVSEMNMLWLPCTAKVTNIYEVAADDNKTLYATIKKRHCSLIYLMRKEALNMLINAKISSQRKRGRPREIMPDGLSQ